MLKSHAEQQQLEKYLITTHPSFDLDQTFPTLFSMIQAKKMTTL